jgi:hypothetical protein
MTRLAETNRALEDNHFVLTSLAGEHFTGRARFDLEDAAVGYTEYNPADHDPEDVDPYGLAPLAIAFGIDHVREIDEVKSLHMNIVLDKQAKKETTAITKRKLLVAGQIATLLEQALPGDSDKGHLYVARNINGPKQGSHRGSDADIVVDNNKGFVRQVLDISSEGLTVLVSDFHRMNFGRNNLEKVIAIKVNDPSERRILRDSRQPISIGGTYEVDRSDPRQVGEYEALLEKTHQDTVERLQNAGAHVVSIVANPNLPAGFDIAATDRDLAQALTNLASKA